MTSKLNKSIKRRGSCSDVTLHISDRGKNSLVRENLKVYKEQVNKKEQLERERLKFERKLNHDAKTLMQALKLPKLPVASQATPASTSPSLSRKNTLGSDKLPLPVPPCTTNRGSINDHPSTNRQPTNRKPEETILPPGSPQLQRSGSFSSVSPASFAQILERRRMTITPLSPLYVTSKPLSPITKNLVKRELLRSESSGESPPNSPQDSQQGSLEEQFKLLVSCRYLRNQECFDDENDST